MSKYKWMSIYTGEVLETFPKVLRAIINDLIYGIHLKWGLKELLYTIFGWRYNRFGY